ncbi:MAG: hypothetical protein PQ612_05765 [Rickettsiales bacterium]|nr:hypothetical protein [Pseudomonadota bacterium]MDA0966527.1 hypothetical protein [Pseudomonadota bacterium]MDG4543389.1 hypothetical protein [Rickettsiales bacterium]MDG4545655.1 hypothetical protein [Rickettsiales bacterium]MDG4548104.1 hypothetical protein [Rickettsiales bacterium]
MVYKEEDKVYCNSTLPDGLYSFFGDVVTTISESYNSNNSTMPNSNSEISLSKISHTPLGQEAYVQNAVEGKIIIGVDEALAQKAWEDKCIQSLFESGRANSAGIAVGSNKGSSYMSYAEKNYFGGTPYSYSVGYSSATEETLKTDRENIERYFQNHHSFEENYLKKIEYESLPQEKTLFWKQRVQRIHDYEDKSWEQRLNDGGVKKSDSFVRFC